MLNVDLNLHQGGFHLKVAANFEPGLTSVFGPSGSGKTTLLQAIAGLRTPTMGQIVLDGRDISRRPAHHRGIGFVFQEPRLFPHLSVKGNLDFAAHFAGERPEQITRDVLLEVLDLQDLLTAMPLGLSGGQAQRVAIARAILTRPRLLCLDEPLASLDAGLKSAILPMLEYLRDQTQLPMLYVSHDISEVARLSDEILLLNAGEVTAHGRAGPLLSAPAHAGSFGRSAGAIIPVTLGAEVNRVRKLQFDGGSFSVIGMSGAQGEQRRIRIAAQDVMIATAPPVNISALNVLRGIVSDMRPDEMGRAYVQIMLGKTPILTQLTMQSLEELKLFPGAEVFAIIKANALDPLGYGA